jgi:hypothetical protein
MVPRMASQCHVGPSGRSAMQPSKQYGIKVYIILSRGETKPKQAEEETQTLAVFEFGLSIHIIGSSRYHVRPSNCEHYICGFLCSEISCQLNFNIFEC